MVYGQQRTVVWQFCVTTQAEYDRINTPETYTRRRRKLKIADVVIKTIDSRIFIIKKGHLFMNSIDNKKGLEHSIS